MTGETFWMKLSVHYAARMQPGQPTGRGHEEMVRLHSRYQGTCFSLQEYDLSQMRD